VPAARWPQAGRGLDTEDVSEAELADTATESRIDAVANVAQHHARRHAGDQRRLDLSERNLRFGAEDDIRRDARFGPSVGIVCPALRQIEPVGDRQARVIARNRQAHRDLAVVLLAELPAILPRHADRIRALLREAGVVDDPGSDRSLSLDDRQHLRPHDRKHGFIRPIRFRHEVMQRLMCGLHPTRLQPRRHRLHALALARQDQSRAISLERRLPIGMADRRR
jgi:hypothetical protein